MHKGKPKPARTAATPNRLSEVPAVNNRRHVLYFGMIAALVAFATYANTFGHGYTVDDDTVMAKNSITKGGIDSLGTVFTSAYRAGFWDRDDNLYRPLSVAMFAIEWHFFPEQPMPGHLINVVLFSLTVFLLMLLLAQMLSDLPLVVPFSIAMLFAVHPIHTEVVANIKSRDEILCLLFAILCLILACRHLKTSKPAALIGSMTCLFLALLSKENAITLLAVIPLTTYLAVKRPLKSVLLSTLPFLGVVAAYLVIRWIVLGDAGKPTELQLINNSLVGASSWSGRFATATVIMGDYLKLLLIPHPLSFDYSFNQIPLFELSSKAFLLWFVVIIAVLVYAFKNLTKADPVAYGILFFGATISLVSNFLILIESTMAERFLYMPSVGFIMSLVVIVAKITKVKPLKNTQRLGDHFKGNVVFTAIIGVLCIGYAAKAVDRNADWKDNYTLLSKDVKTAPKSARIRYAYGSALLFEKALKEENSIAKANFLDQAVMHLSKGVEILPEYSEAWRHLAIAFKEQENHLAAVTAFEKARSYKEFDAADIFATSGMCYGKVGRYREALADLNRALAMNPDDPESNNNKGLYLFESGAVDSSLVYFDKAIALKKDFHQAYYNKGNTFAHKGNYAEALRLYGIALQINPSSVDALMNSGNCHAAQNQLDQALAFFKKVEQLEPNNQKMLMNIGITYKNMGQEALASAYFARVQNTSR